MTRDDVKETIIKLLLGKLNEKCSSLCRKDITSPFCTLPADQMASFKWVDMATDLKVKAPLFFTLLDSIASRNKTLGRARDPRANGAWLNKQTE